MTATSPSLPLSLPPGFAGWIGRRRPDVWQEAEPEDTGQSSKERRYAGLRDGTAILTLLADRKTRNKKYLGLQSATLVVWRTGTRMETMAAA